MGRKLNPDASYLEIEKSFLKNKGKLDYGEPSKKNTVMDETLRRPPRMPDSARPDSVRDDTKLNLQRPALDKRRKEVRASEKPVSASKPEKIADNYEAAEVALRKPAPLQGADMDLEKYSKFRMKPNLSLKMKTPEDTTDVTLLKKPEIVMNLSNDSNADDGESEGEFLIPADETASLGMVGDGDDDFSLSSGSDNAEIGNSKFTL